MSRSTRIVSLAVASIFMLVPAGLAQAEAASSNDTVRACRGEVLTLGWGAVVRDDDGPCRRIETPRRGSAARPTPPSALPNCPNRRSYLGGALQICDNQPPARSPR